MNNKQRDFLQRKILKTGVFQETGVFSTNLLIEDYSQQIVQSEAVSKYS